MPHIPEEIIETIRQQANLVDIAGSFMELRKTGKRYLGCCPFHNEKTPSFQINEEKQLFYCFGCKKSGNLFKFVQEITNTDFVGAVRWLANRLNITIPENTNPEEQRFAEARRQMRNDGYRLLLNASQWFQGQLNQPGGEVARKYLVSRGIDEATIQKFSIGYAPDTWDSFRKWALNQGFSDDILLKTGMVIQKEENAERIYDRFRGRLVFTIRDELERVVGFSARILTSDHQAAKYVNSPESDFFKKGKILYGLHLAQKAFQNHKTALVCEGQMDVIACHRAGLDNAVAAQGTAFTADHAALLKRSTSAVKLAFDGDEAGLKATMRTIALLQEEGLTVSIVTLPDGEDPDSIFRLGGPQALQQVMSHSEPAIQFAYRKAAEKYDATTPEGKSAISADVLELIATISDNIARTAHCQWLARQMQLPEVLFLSNLTAILQRKQRTEENRANFRNDNFTRPADNAVRTSAPPPFMMAPVSQPSSGEETTFAALLDLTLRYRNLADRLCADDELLALLPDTPLGHALTLVTAAVQQEEWENCSETLTASELSSEPAIALVLMQSQFDCLNPENAKSEDKKAQLEQALQQAYLDCKRKLLRREYDRQTNELNERLRLHPEEQQEILPKLFELARKKKRN